MTSESARAWLPDSAHGVEQGRRAFDAIIAAWSSDWIEGQKAVIALARLAERGSPANDKALIADKGEVEVGISARAKRLLFETICAVDLAEVELGEVEHKLIDALVQRALDDLAERLAGQAEAAAHAPRDVQLGITLAGRELFGVRMTRALFAVRLKASLAKGAAQRRHPLLRRQRALGRLTIPLRAIVGRGSLSLSELHALGRGDILLLDQQADEGVALEVVGSGAALLFGRLSRDGDRPALNF